MKHKVLYVFAVYAFSAGANASEGKKINCLAALEDGFQVGVCENVIDTMKLKTIDCLGELEDGYQVNVCSNAKNPNNLKNTIDCTQELEDGYQRNLCSTVPDPNTVVRINCLEGLQDGYQANLCSQVDVDVQGALNKRL